MWLTQVPKAEDAAAVGDDDDLDVVGGPIVHDVPVAAALVEAVKVHAQSLPAIASDIPAQMISATKQVQALWRQPKSFTIIN